MSLVNREYDKEMVATGNKVVLRKLEKYHEREQGGIFIPESTDINHRMCKAVVESIGRDAESSNLKVGDTVLYDTMAVFYDHHPCVVINVENIIVICEGDEFIPLGNFVMCTREEYAKEQGGVVIPDNVQEISPKYRVQKLGRGEYGIIKPGDKVVVNIGDRDFLFTDVTYEGQTIRMLDVSNIIAVIDD